MYQYNVFSKRIGNIDQMNRYRDAIVKFYQERYPDENPREYQDMFELGISGWAGAILAFEKNKVVGYINFSEVNHNKHIYDVGFAYVDENHRQRGIYSKLSKYAEKESKSMGAKMLRRFISNDDEFLAKRLLREGYKVQSSNSEDWNTYPLGRRL